MGWKRHAAALLAPLIISTSCATLGGKPDPERHERLMRLYAIGTEAVVHHDELFSIGDLDSDGPPVLNYVKLGAVEGPLPNLPVEGTIDVAVTLMDREPFARRYPFPGYEDAIIFHLTTEDGENDLAFFYDNNLDLALKEVELYGEKVRYGQAMRELYHAIIDGLYFPLPQPAGEPPLEKDI